MDNKTEIQKIEDLKMLFDTVKDTSDLYYLSLMILSGRINSGYILPELIFLLDEQSLSNFLYYYGGQTVTIPTLPELRDTLYGILAYYYHDLKGMSWRDTTTKVGNGNYSRELSAKLRWLRTKVIDNLDGIKIPEVKSDNKM